MQNEAKGTAYIAMSSALFAGMAVGARLLSKQLSPGQLSSARFLVGIVAGAGVLWFLRQRPTIQRPWLWVLRGVFGGLSAYLYFVAIEHLDVGPATLLNNTSPAFTSVFAYFYLRERMSAHAIAGLVLSMVGSGLVALGTQQPDHPLALGVGVWAGIASAVLSGVAIVIMRSLRRDTDALTIFLSFCVFGLMWAAPLAAFDWRPMGLDLVIPALTVGVLSFGAQLLYTHGLGFVPAGSGSAVNLLTPALSWMAGIWWLGESASPLSLFGAGVTALGVFWGSIAAPYLAGRLPRPAAAG